MEAQSCTCDHAIASYTVAHEVTCAEDAWEGSVHVQGLLTNLLLEFFELRKTAPKK